jgi:gliding motility-associated-like protein
MQITVYACNNQPPAIQPLQDMCIVVGTTGSQAITAFDPNNDAMDLEMFGETFELALTPSTFTQTNSFNPAMGTFLWSPSCSRIQVNPYTAFVKAIDNSNQGPDLSDIDFFQIRVIAPPVENLLTDVQQGGDIILSWDMASCDNASGYKVYRRIGSSSFIPGPCVTGLPASAGYDLVSTIEGNTVLSYLDTDVPYGSEVCYRVVACFPDGAQSIVSDEVCDRIERVKPAITQATVDVTDVSTGQTTVRWAAPLDLDTLAIFTGPYSYQISRRLGNGAFVGIGSTSATTVLNVPEEDLFFIDSGLNTVDEQISYKVEFLNDGSVVSTSTAATTVYMTLTPLDNRVLIEWTEDVPWINDSYDIFTVDPTSGVQTFLVNVAASPYEHLGLTNGTEYCYVVKSYGMYDPSSGLLMSIENYSQEACTRPIDLEAPCAPFLSFDGTCIEENYTLHWIVYDQPCNDDVTAYNVYYAENDTAEYVFLTQITDPTTFSYSPPQEFAVGCMVITALDSLLIQPDGSVTQNESPFSERICLESCPTYELPNVISPNGDGQNDIFMPFEPYRYVDSVDFQIFNRWGQIVFETHDPALQWKGDNKDSGEQVSDGVYFYTIVIYEKRLQGITPRSEAGNIQVLDNRGFNNK